MLQSDNLAKVHGFTAFLNKHYASHPELLKTQFKRNSQVHFHMLKWAVINNP